MSELVPMLGGQVVDYVDTLDPYAPGMVINWAGDDPAPLWIQIGRELTERWMHHQHICDAVGVSSLKEADMVHAVLEMFIRALPHTYRTWNAAGGKRDHAWLIRAWAAAAGFCGWKLSAGDCTALSMTTR